MASYSAAAYDPHDPEPAYWGAGESAFCGRPVDALHMLQYSIAHGYCAYPAMDRDPVFSSLRSLPEFAALRTQAQQCQQRFLDYRRSHPAPAR